MNRSHSKTVWTMKVAKCPWTEDTVREVAFVKHVLSLTGKERILDLGCGYGRHALSLAELGCDVVGIDMTPEYIEVAKSSAITKHANIEFVCANILDAQYESEFDVVLNLGDGGIGYCKSEDENKAMFDIITRALVPNGQHLLQVLNRQHAEKYFPRRDWDFGQQAISLVDFQWDSDKNRMYYSERLAYWGQVLNECDEVLNTSVRLYSLSELEDILERRGMRVVCTSSSLTERIEFQGNELILVVHSKKVEYS